MAGSLVLLVHVPRDYSDKFLGITGMISTDEHTKEGTGHIWLEPGFCLSAFGHAVRRASDPITPPTFPFNISKGRRLERPALWAENLLLESTYRARPRVLFGVQSPYLLQGTYVRTPPLSWKDPHPGCAAKSPRKSYERRQLVLRSVPHELARKWQLVGLLLRRTLSSAN